MTGTLQYNKKITIELNQGSFSLIQSPQKLNIISTTEVLSVAWLLYRNALHCQVLLFHPNPEHLMEL